MDNRTILCVVEGEKTELQILESLKKILHEIITDNFKIISYETNIYQLYAELVEDEDNLDLIGILKEKDSNGFLSNIKRSDISDVFLFFDHDGHDSKASDEVIYKMLEKFSNETENGKLYISYPMVEALKHLKNSNWDFQYNERVIEKKNFSNYKDIVASETCYQDITSYNFLIWQHIVKQNITKANFLVNKDIKSPEFEKIIQLNQVKIFEKQVKEYLMINSEVTVLSGFPFFLVEYIKKDVYEKYFMIS